MAKPGKYAFSVEGRVHHTDDKLLAGRDIRSISGHDPAADYRLIRIMDRYTSSIGLEDRVELEEGEIAIFRVFEGDRDYDFTVEDRGWEWGASSILEAEVREYGRIAPERDLVLDGPTDHVIPRGGTIALSGGGVERIISRKAAEPKRVHVTFVINGEPEKVEASPGDRLIEVLAVALDRSENTGQPVESWQVTDEPGNPLDESQTLAQLGIVDGAVLIASLKTGAAG